MSGQGGFWNAPQVVYSKQTHDLLKDMMKESKLTNFQQKHLERTMRDGGKLPLRVAPTTSKTDHRKVKVQVPPPKVINPRNYHGGVRSKESMTAMGAFVKTDYVPPRGVTRSAREKEKLANIMAYGEDQPKIPMKNIKARLEPLAPLPDRFDELQSEIHERQNFLREMESLGKGESYRTIIATEISQKIREMELIDKKRSSELQAMIDSDEKKRQDSENKKKHLPKPSFD